MCGAEDAGYKAEIEGTLMDVCRNCARYGKTVSSPRRKGRDFRSRKPKTRQPYSEEELNLTIISNYGQTIKQKREKIGLSQEDFAKHINEKSSLIGKIETNQFEPSIKLAKKIEKFLHISLIERSEETPRQKQAKNKDTLTIGDLIQIKKK
jgi:putative transcription factor